MTAVSTTEGFAGPLVSGEQLQHALGEERVRVIDVRGRHPSSALPHAKRSEYESAHIPGALFVDWEHDFIDTEDPVPVQLAEAHAFARRAGELGISERHVIVAYDDYYGIFAARIAWAFRVYGAHACVLDGGWQTWIEEGRATAAGAVSIAPTQFNATPRPRLRRSLSDVLEARERGATLIDARPRHLYLGEQAPNSQQAAHCGHIPGALCLPYQELVDGATGLWAAPEAIARLARDAGLDPQRPPRELIATCGSGISATVAMLALERLGIHSDGVYDGSFNEWSASGSLPIEYGRVP